MNSHFNHNLSQAGCNPSPGPLEKWRIYCDDLTWKHGSLDESTWNAFLRAAAIGIGRAYALEAVLRRLQEAGAEIQQGKIESQLRRAYDSIASSRWGWGSTSSGGTTINWNGSSKSKRQTINFEEVDRIVSNGPRVAELFEGEWKGDDRVGTGPAANQGDASGSCTAASGSSPTMSRTEEIIDSLFPGNPLLCAGGTVEHFATGHREAWRGKLSGAQFIVPSPMSALKGKVKYGNGRLSAHTLANTGRRRFLVIEWDMEEFDRNGLETAWSLLIRKWREGGRSIQDACAALLMHLASSGNCPWAYPLTMVVHSGGKSLHGWFYCQGAHEQKLGVFMRRAERLGADHRTWQRSQFVRMPDGRRPDGRRQSVLYFNSTAAQNGESKER